MPRLFDSDENQVSIEHVAEGLCADKSGSSTKEQISRVSTILKLHNYLVNQTHPDIKLIDCSKRYGNILADLRDIVERSNDNVCSDEKIYLIDEFHRNYISTARDDIKLRYAEVKQAAPEVLRLFFMHYAMEVSAICKRGLITNIEWDLQDKHDEDEFDFESETFFNKLMEKMSTSFSPVTAVNDYDDALLIWDLVQHNGNEETDPLTGESVKLYVKTNQIEQIKQIQERCRCRFRPFYDKLIMPIISLSDMGYSCSGERFERELGELKTNKLVNRWYGITQVCEAILPIKFYQDSSLQEHETVIISKDEAQLLNKERSDDTTANKICRPVQYEPTTNSISGVDKLDSVETVEAQELVQDVSLKTSVKERAIKRAYRRLIKNIKEKKTNKVYYSHKVQPQVAAIKEVKTTEKQSDPADKHGFVKVELQHKLGQQLDRLSDEELLSLEGAFGRKGGLIKRHKRGPRPGDVNLLQLQRDQVLSYEHTKSLSDIISGWIDEISPSRRTIMVFGALVLGALILGIVLAV